METLNKSNNITNTTLSASPIHAKCKLGFQPASWRSVTSLRDWLTMLIFVIAFLPCIGFAQDIKPSATEDWSHQPPVVSPPLKGNVPSDAIVLFRQKEDLKNWEHIDGAAVKWQVRGKTLRIVKDAGDIRTKQKFGRIQLHIEWKTPDPKEDESTDRGNSGIYFMGLYELQIYESYQYQTRLYYNGIAGSIYKQQAPMVNACLPAQTWQVFDVIFDPPVFENDKTLASPAYITVFHNGVLIHDHVALKGPTIYAGYPQYAYHDEKLPLLLQEHDSRVSFRNIWLRELP